MLSFSNSHILEHPYFDRHWGGGMRDISSTTSRLENMILSVIPNEGTLRTFDAAFFRSTCL